jgi:hypothetical protein
MRRSLSNPRIVLAYLAFVALIWSVVWAYLARPRIVAEFGALGDTVPIRQERFGVDVQLPQFRDRFERRLGSASFMDPLMTVNGRMPRLFVPNAPTVTSFDPILDLGIAPTPGQAGSKNAFSTPSTPNADLVSRTIKPGLKGDRIVFWTGKSGRSDLFVTYLYLRSYSVTQPPNAWIAWLQRWLPGMPNAEEIHELAAQADAANQSAKDAIKAQIEAAAQQGASGR